MTRVFVTRRVPESVHRVLADRFDIDYHDAESPLPREELLSRAAGADGLVTTLTEKVDVELLETAGPQLKVVANYAVGFDNVDLAAASERGVLVTNTPDVLTDATAEFAIASMLSLVRRVTDGDRFLRRREPWIWAPTMMLGNGAGGRLLGVVGYGRIGRQVARLGAGLGMRVCYSDFVDVADDEFEQVPLERLLSEAHVVSVHCPLTPETRHLIGAAETRAMRSDAVLVNTSRGPVVDEQALVEALRSGEIAGAALDVFENEPSVPEALLEMDNVVVTPHLASATHDSREAMGMLCVDALTSVFRDEATPSNALNAKEVAAVR